jgi:hypothetical protein
MAAIDLIPMEYRAQRRNRRLRVLALGVAGLLLLGVGAARGGLQWAIRQEEARSGDLERNKDRLAVADGRLKKLETRRASLQDRLRALESVLRGPDLGASFLALDRALQPELRFLELSFVRQGEVVAARPGTPVHGYFIVLPKDEAAGRSAEAGWQLEQRIEIRGQAAGHAQLTEFLARLAADPAMRQVRLLDTGLRAYSETSVVDFRLAALLSDTPVVAGHP